MAYALVAAVALVAAGLTLFSGFGLGTLLLPAFAVFFPPEIAVGATAVVHFANNLFKLVLIGRDAQRGVVLRFGVPAVVAAVVGALLLERLARVNEPLASYRLAGRDCEVTPIGLIVGLLIVVFAAIEWHPRMRQLEIHPRFLSFGGMLSGFFGGLSGHQGALRSAFLIRAGLDRDQFVATAAVCSVLVDVARLLVYGAVAALVAGRGAGTSAVGGLWPLVAVGCISAFVGSYVGALLVKKFTLRWLQSFVAVALMLFGAVIAGGIV